MRAIYALFLVITHNGLSDRGLISTYLKTEDAETDKKFLEENDATKGIANKSYEITPVCLYGDFNV